MIVLGIVLAVDLLSIEMEYEELLNEFGSTGWYSLFLFVLISFSGSATFGLSTFSINFLGSRTDYQCRLPDTEITENAEVV